MESDSLDLEQYTYDAQGRVRVAWLGTTREMTYKLVGADSLYYFKDGQDVSRFRILGLNDTQLVLRKNKPPLFTGNGQERYEVRYFTRID
jgi:hypothetical protein